MSKTKAVTIYFIFLGLYLPFVILLSRLVLGALQTIIRGQPFQVSDSFIKFPIHSPVFLVSVVLMVAVGAYAVAKNPEKLFGKNKKDTFFGALIMPFGLAAAKFFGLF